ncbi:hypothetical protein N5P37_002044 [Trichoderma harzianum]|nr:hypothetical protein N5P37_002044 [Trichoderma harzianum]
MTSTQDDDPFYGSDDELPSLDALLTRIPGRIQQQLSQPKPISKPIPTNAIWIELEDDDSSVENQTTDKEDFIYSLSDAEPEKAIPALVKGEVRKRWQSSSERFDDDDLKGEEKRPSRPLGRSTSTQKSKPHEVDIRSRKPPKTKNNIPSKIESQASIKQPQGPSETSNGAPKNTISNASGPASRLPQSQANISERSRYNGQEGPLTQHPRSVSPSRSRITKSSRQPHLPKHQESKDIVRPLPELLLDIQDGMGANTLHFPIMPPKESKQKKLVSSHREIHAEEASQEPAIDTGRLQDFIDEWDEPELDRKTKSSTQSTVPKSPSKRQTKKSFDAIKSQLAIDFLQQLDTQITHGKVGELTQSTGGVKIVWSNTLKTTAGRANWKRETIISKHIGDSAKADVKQYRHHSSIELSEKVIDDELRLLNVIAHEFCHLANFIINGITDNPHGKEFKVWAAKCTQLFGSQGIKVTTKHSYEIDFKYVWTCTACGCEYKRHSKSIDPKRHRCGASAIFSPSVARIAASTARDWSYVDAWLASKSPAWKNSLPSFERNQDTLKALLALVSLNEAADDQRRLLARVDATALQALSAHDKAEAGITANGTTLTKGHLLDAIEHSLPKDGVNALDVLTAVASEAATASADPDHLGSLMLRLQGTVYGAEQTAARVDAFDRQLQREAEAAEELLHTLQSESYKPPSDLAKQNLDVQRRIKTVSAQLPDLHDRVTALGASIATPYMAIGDVIELEQRYQALLFHARDLSEQIAALSQE